MGETAYRPEEKVASRREGSNGRRQVMAIFQDSMENWEETEIAGEDPWEY